jgi:hypothetical protein
MDPDGLKLIKITYDNGTYLGQYVTKEDGTPAEHGTGLFIWSNGDRYEGEYVMGARTGLGTFQWADGKIYEGEFEDDRRHGLGKMTWTDGTVYEGDFEDGIMSGKGKLTWPAGDFYIGWFSKGFMEGYGIHYAADGTKIYEGDWIESCPVDKT